MKPYVPFELDELTVLRSVERWTNTRVRVFGKIGRSIPESSCSSFELRYLHSVGEEKESDVIVDFSLILDVFHSSFSEGSVVQILGELEPFSSSITVDDKVTSAFIVRAHIIRDFATVDPKLYHKASALQAIACPKHFFALPLRNLNGEEADNSSSFQHELDLESEQLGEPDKKTGCKDDYKENKNKVINNDTQINDSSVDMFADSD